ncbi:hypothetical protein [Azospirillum argentinense]
MGGSPVPDGRLAGRPNGACRGCGPGRAGTKRPCGGLVPYRSDGLCRRTGVGWRTRRQPQIVREQGRDSVCNAA